MDELFIVYKFVISLSSLLLFNQNFNFPSLTNLIAELLLKSKAENRARWTKMWVSVGQQNIQ